jgi:hypothetical protein
VSINVYLKILIAGTRDRDRIMKSTNKNKEVMRLKDNSNREQEERAVGLKMMHNKIQEKVGV